MKENLNKTALITGASSGIGRDMARVLAQKGYNLILVSRNEENMLKLKEELNTNVEIFTMDLAKIENCVKLYEQVKSVDILINNAGFGVFGRFEEIDLNKEIELINTNIVAVHTLTKLFLQDMKQKKVGHILNVASIASFTPGPLMASYYASKAYVLRLSEAISEELKKSKSNVKISVLCPGPVRTNFNNVAGVKFNLNSLSSEYVARYAIEKMLKNKLIIVPGKVNNVLRFVLKIVPENICRKVNYYMQKRKRD